MKAKLQASESLLDRSHLFFWHPLCLETSRDSIEPMVAILGSHLTTRATMAYGKGK